MDKNEHKKSYRPCIQHQKFITVQIKKLKKIMSDINTIILFLNHVSYHLIL